tara:strand:- start:3139 stop:3474 length:336 start_codon:yes stop_codon:yes gene_type:complete
MIQTSKQTHTPNFTRKQKKGFFGFLKTDIDIGKNVVGLFRGLRNRFTPKKPFYQKVIDNVPPAPKQFVTGISAGVKNIPDTPKKHVNKNLKVPPKSKGPFGGTRKKKQRKH